MATVQEDLLACGFELRETHISQVFLGETQVFKIKKPVDLGFLDFTSRERRLTDCEDEVRLNRRLCPDLYLGVVEVVERDGAYFVAGPGRPVEPAVWMRRLPEEGMLSTLLDRQAAEAPLMRRIARQLAEFHAAAATGLGLRRRPLRIGEADQTQHRRGSARSIHVYHCRGDADELTLRMRTYSTPMIAVVE